jgi:hypothetical protein
VAARTLQAVAALPRLRFLVDELLSTAEGPPTEGPLAASCSGPGLAVADASDRTEGRRWLRAGRGQRTLRRSVQALVRPLDGRTDSMRSNEQPACKKFRRRQGEWGGSDVGPAGFASASAAG